MVLQGCKKKEPVSTTMTNRRFLGRKKKGARGKMTINIHGHSSLNPSWRERNAKIVQRDHTLSPLEKLA